jgi:hypothetical protein
MPIDVPLRYSTRPPKSLIRMFDPRCNAQARNLLGIIAHLQKQAEIELRVMPR